MITFEKPIYAVASLIAGTVLLLLGGAKSASGAETLSTKNPNHKQCVAHGGLGLFARKLYIETENRQNRLMFADGSKTKFWEGSSWQVPQVVVVWHSGVVDVNALPSDFKLSESTIISFGPREIEFFNLDTGFGCFYQRIIPEVSHAENKNGE
jgi:hypothetical protein